jgi:hypothetical protein
MKRLKIFVDWFFGIGAASCLLEGTYDLLAARPLQVGLTLFGVYAALAALEWGTGRAILFIARRITKANQ